MELKEKYFKDLNRIRVETLHSDVYVSVLTGTIVSIAFSTRFEHSDKDWLQNFHFSTCFEALLWGIFHS